MEPPEKLRRLPSEIDIISYKFKNLLFLPIKFSEINAIEFLITDKFGKVMKYDKGHISLILVIRPIRNN